MSTDAFFTQFPQAARVVTEPSSFKGRSGRRVQSRVMRLAEAFNRPEKLTGYSVVTEPSAVWGPIGIGLLTVRGERAWYPAKYLLDVVYYSDTGQTAVAWNGGPPVVFAGTTKDFADKLASVLPIPAQPGLGWWSDVPAATWPNCRVIGPYIGGLAERPGPSPQCKLVLRPGALTIVDAAGGWGRITPWGDVAAIHVDGRNELRSRVTLTRLFVGGILAFGAPKAERAVEAFVTVSYRNGEAAVVHLPGVNPVQLRALYAPIISGLEQAAAPLSAPPAAQSLGEQLEQIARLHREGVLDTEEFQAAKSQLLGRS